MTRPRTPGAAKAREHDEFLRVFRLAQLMCHNDGRRWLALPPPMVVEYRERARAALRRRRAS